jgi:hypothetical protein
MNTPNRAKTILWLTDEDLEMAGVDPNTISDEMFDTIVDYMAEYVDANFSDALHNGLEYYDIETNPK